MKVGILSASSQVASSVAFYLKYFTESEVICFIRSEYSAVYFELLDIQYYLVDIGNDALLKQQFNDIDILLDFSYPTGQLYEIPGHIRTNYERYFQAMSKGTTFINMSSIMAYGMPDNEKNLRNYRFPRASYGYIKRLSEQVAFKFGKRYGIRVFNFRLSQVHGFMQSVDSSFREKLRNKERIYLDGNPEDKTNTIFISSLCHAILSIYNSNKSSATFTLVSQPQWTLEELYNYYITIYGFETRICYMPNVHSMESVSWKSRILNMAKKFRPLIETYLLLRSPKISTWLKGRYKVSEAYTKLHPGENIEYADFNLLGVPKMQTIGGIQSSMEEVISAESEMKRIYTEVMEKRRAQS